VIGSAEGLAGAEVETLNILLSLSILLDLSTNYSIVK
jgi:hypothetical protein